jgi:Na+/proline symporter
VTGSLRLAALGGSICLIAFVAIVGAVLGGLIGLQSGDPRGPFDPTLNGGMRGAYAGMAAGALVAIPLALLFARAVRRWARLPTGSRHG